MVDATGNAVEKRTPSARRGRAALLCALLGLVAAVGLAQAPEVAASEVAAPEVAALRVAHLSPDAPQYDVLIDGRLSLRDLPFPSVSRYLIIPSGRHEVRLFPHQGPVRGENGEANPLQPLEPLTITVDLDAGGYYTVAVSGFYNPPAAGASSGALTVQLEPGVSAQVRGPRNYLVTLSESSPLTNLEPGTYTITASGEGFRTAQYEIEVTPGSALTLPIRLQAGEGESQPSTSAPELEVGERTWTRTQLHLYSDDYAGFPAAGEAYVRFVHAAPAIPTLGVLGFDGASETTQYLVERLDYPNASAFLSVPITLGGLRITVAGSDLVLNELDGVTLDSGAFYTIYLSGSTASGKLNPIPYIESALRGALP